MKTKIALAITIPVILLLSLTGCVKDTTSTAPAENTTDSSSYSEDDGTSVGGFGMTYGGKPGIDLGGGFVMPFDGSSPGLGMGF